MAWNIEEAIAWYKNQGAPGEQNALLGLLREVQREHGGGIPAPLLAPIAGAYEVKESYLLALIRRIPSLRLSDSHCLELCAGPNCSRHRALADYAETHPGNYTVKYVPCMRLCGKGPNLRWDGKLYHQADEALLRNLLEK